MSEWIVDIQSMIPMGQLGERMVVVRVDHRAGTFAIMKPPDMVSRSMGEGVSEAEVFMNSHTSHLFQPNEIDQFLLAMMEAGWRRGLRPSKFDPSAGELAAVNRHLEDMRRVAMQRVDPSAAAQEQVSIGQEAAAKLGSLSDIGVDPDKTW